jgi:mannose-6-phosphate isomerase-like protein (cupin superfamily)
MFVQNRLAAPSRQRAGLVSRILLQKGDIQDTGITVTWVEVAMGSQQQPHQHEPEQVYVLITGKGQMSVGNEVQEVVAGDLVYIPPHTLHSIKNTGNEILSYVSATAAAFDFKTFYDEGKL